MKIVFRLLSVAVLALTALAGVLVWRTLSFGPSENPVTQGEENSLPPVPEMNVDRMSSTLTRAIQARTITLAPGDPREGQEGPWLELHAALQEAFPTVHSRLTLDRFEGLSLRYTWIGSDPSLPPLVLMAHQDVVPVNIGTESDWSHPPFSGQIADGYIYGRGAMDNKGAIVALLEAVEQLLLDGYQPRRTVVLAFGHDEEVLGQGAKSMAETFAAASIKPFMVLDEGFAVIDPFPLTGKPTALVGVSEKGYLTLILTAKAAGGHSSMPPRNTGAVRIAKAVVALDKNQLPAAFEREPVQQMLRQTAPEMPFLTRMAFANLWLFRPLIEAQIASDGATNAVMRTTTAPTMLEGSVKENVLPQAAKVTLNFRVHPSNTVDDVIEHVRRVVAPYDLEIEVLGVPADTMAVSPLSGPQWESMRTVAAAVQPGALVAPGLVLGATDARWYVGKASAVYRFHPAIYSRADLNGFHGTNERLEIANLDRMGRGYAQLIKLASETGLDRDIGLSPSGTTP